MFYSHLTGGVSENDEDESSDIENDDFENNSYIVYKL